MRTYKFTYRVITPAPFRPFWYGQSVVAPILKKEFGKQFDRWSWVNPKTIGFKSEEDLTWFTLVFKP